MSKPAYAAGTSVSVEKSRAEIEATLKRYRANAFGYATEGRRVVIRFKLAERWIQFVLMLPDPTDREFTHTATRRVRESSAVEAAWEQACRQKWRALLLIIKAKLEAVEAGITTVEDEFLAATVLPDGSTVGQWAREEVTNAYRLGHMPRSLLALAGPSDG